MKDSRIRTAVVILALILAVASVVLVTITSADAASIQRGSSGDTVRQIQTKLKQWGYYAGAVDGVYGSGTEKAVRYFQQKNGLAVDGKAGAKTLAALGIASSTPKSSAQLDLLARLISAEARGEPYSGQVAVGAAAPWCSTVCAIRRFPIRLPASSIKTAPSPVSMTVSSTSPWQRAPTEQRRTRSTAGTPPAAPFTILIPPKPQANGSGHAR